MSEMIERVAKAILNELMLQDGDDNWELEDGKIGYLDQGEVDMHKVARAAVEAMLKPTAAMIEAQQSLCVYRDDADKARDAEALTNAWETMARAALS